LWLCTAKPERCGPWIPCTDRRHPEFGIERARCLIVAEPPEEAVATLRASPDAARGQAAPMAAGQVIIELAS
jgi:hypothetical protein